MNTIHKQDIIHVSHFLQHSSDMCAEPDQTLYLQKSKHCMHSSEKYPGRASYLLVGTEQNVVLLFLFWRVLYEIDK